MSKDIEIFHLESQTIMRDIVEVSLGRDGFTSYAGRDPRSNEVIRKVDTLRVNLLLLGVNANEPLQVADAIELSIHLRKKRPDITIIAHSVFSNVLHITQLMDAGISGFVDKSLGYDALLAAIRAAFEGRTIIKVKGLDEAIPFPAHDDKKSSRTGIFTSRETEVLLYLSKGYSTQEIADQLFVSDRTVETHRKNLVNKLAVKNTAELISYCCRIGLV